MEKVKNEIRSIEENDDQILDERKYLCRITDSVFVDQLLAGPKDNLPPSPDEERLHRTRLSREAAQAREVHARGSRAPGCVTSVPARPV